MVFSPTTGTGTAVLEYGATEILPQVGALSKHTERLCRPGRQADRAHPRGKPGFWTFESGCGRETDSLLRQADGDGFRRDDLDRGGSLQQERRIRRHRDPWLAAQQRRQGAASPSRDIRTDDPEGGKKRRGGQGIHKVRGSA